MSMKSRPFLIAALGFGGIGVIVLILTIISFFCGDNLISAAIGGGLGLGTDSFNDATMGQISVVFFIPAFIFAFRCFADNESEPEPEEFVTITDSDSAAVTASSK